MKQFNELTAEKYNKVLAVDAIKTMVQEQATENINDEIDEIMSGFTGTWSLGDRSEHVRINTDGDYNFKNLRSWLNETARGEIFFSDDNCELLRFFDMVADLESYTPPNNDNIDDLVWKLEAETIEELEAVILSRLQECYNKIDDDDFLVEIFDIMLGGDTFENYFFDYTNTDDIIILEVIPKQVKRIA